MSSDPPARNPPSGREGLNRRDFLSYVSGIGLSGALLPGVLWARLQQGPAITTDILSKARLAVPMEGRGACL